MEADGDTDRDRARPLLGVSRETEERLSVYVELLRRWQRVKNLVGPATLDHVWFRHVADSAQLVAFCPDARTWADMGSGAGFPGLVTAILLRDEPGAHVHLVESNSRKCAFLREVIRETGAPAVVHAARIEDVMPTLPLVDAVSARALAPLSQLVLWGKRLIDAGSVGVFPKGEEFAGESATVDADYDVEAIPSRTHSGARILLVRRAPAAHAERTA